MKRIILLFVGFFILMQYGYCQKITVTGVVTAKEDGQPIIGASVMEKGTTNGVITNFNGVYSISVKNGATLIFTYVGMDKQEVKVAGAGKQDVVLKSNSVVMDEVVITAMGVKQEKKKLNFAVQSIGGEQITDSKSANFVNSLQGKVAGVSVTSGGGSPNSGSQIILRAVSSMNAAQNNEPLFVVDGLPISGGGTSAADINPNDIENITILKGAAASALYGQGAANGVIMITTKQGVKGKLTVTANTSWQWDNAVRTPELQTIYGPGSLGFYRPESTGGSGGWGPLLNAGTKTYDNIKNFFKQGFYQKYDLSVSSGSEKFSSVTSANYSSNEGIVPNDYLKKLGIAFKATYDVSKMLSFGANLRLVNDTYRSTSGTSSSYGVSSAYLWPITDDITDYKTINGTPRFRYLNETDKSQSPISPLWSRYMDSNENKKNRSIVQGSVIFKPLKGLEITGRVSMDQSNNSNDGYSVPRFDDSVILPNAPEAKSYGDNVGLYMQDLAKYNANYNSTAYLNVRDLANIDKNLLGNYSYDQSSSRLITANLMASYKTKLTSDFDLNVLVGSEIRDKKSTSSSLDGRDFIVPGLYSISNVAEINGVDDVSILHEQIRNLGVYGEARLDYKGIVNLSVTSRFDWSSTLQLENSPYFYPSVTGGLIFSELFKMTNDFFSYGKIRGNLAQVGKDAPSAALYNRKYIQYPTLPDGGYGVDPSKSVASNDLRPEMSKSWEIGMETRFFKNKTRLDMAYYSTAVSKQIVTVRVSPTTSYILQTRNEGELENHGVEITLDQEILKTKDFQWNGIFNFSFNRGTVVNLPDGMVEIQGPQYVDIFPTSYLHGSSTAISGKDYLRNSEGKVICSAEGYPQINPTKSVLIGNREPDFLLGFSSNIRYKNVSLGFLIDGRKGGDVVNATGRGLWTSGQHKALENYRGRQIVWDGVVLQADGSYAKNTTPIVLDNKTITNYYTDVSSNFIEDGSYIRLSYLTLGYDFTNMIKKNNMVKALKLSLTGTNLFLLTKYTGTDPQLNASTSTKGTGSAGIDNYAVPNTRGFNVSIKAEF